VFGRKLDAFPEGGKQKFWQLVGFRDVERAAKFSCKIVGRV
jgi:hypothetical protein